MAQAVTVKPGDTVTRLLKHHRGLKDHEIYAWLSKMRLLNPHISNLNRIHPMDKVLLPERLSEAVPDRHIWQNAFENIPQALTRNGSGNHTAYLCLAGETIDDVAGRMFAGTPYSGMLPSTKRAVLIHNNPVLCDHLADGKIQTATLLDITPARFSDIDRRFWNSQRSQIAVGWNQLSEASKQVVRDTGVEESTALAELLQSLRQMGAAVDMQDMVRFGGYGVGVFFVNPFLCHTTNGTRRAICPPSAANSTARCSCSKGSAAMPPGIYPRPSAFTM